MSREEQPKTSAWICEGAGLVGLVSALLVLTLAYGAYPRYLIWLAAGVSLVGNLIYITHIFMRRATGINGLNWRELLLATIVPIIAVGITIVMVSEVSGLFHLPFVGADQPDNQRVINITPGQEDD